MSISRELVEYLTDTLSPLGAISARRMFSGYGIKCGEVNFALLLGSGAYFRVDDSNRGAFEAEGSTPFRYMKKDKEVTVGTYWEIPGDVLDDPDRLLEWGHEALDAARRSWKPKKKRKSR